MVCDLSFSETPVNGHACENEKVNAEPEGSSVKGIVIIRLKNEQSLCSEEKDILPKIIFIVLLLNSICSLLKIRKGLNHGILCTNQFYRSELHWLD